MSIRFLYSNLITASSMLTVNSVAAGEVGDAQKQGDGSATMETGGTYSGSTHLVYVVEIDSVGGGAEVGQATFKWSDDGGSTWDASGVTTDSVWVTLNNGVTVRWTSGTGDDFVLGDRWTFIADSPFGKGKLLDLNRDQRYRTGGLASPEYITIDFGTATTVTAVVIHDHNITSGATITLKAHTSDSWGTPDKTQAVSHNAGIIVIYLTGTWSKRYYRLEVTDAANPDGYIEIGELFMCTYVAPTRQPSAGHQWQYRIITEKQDLEYGGQATIAKNLGWIFNLKLHACESADYGIIETLLRSVYVSATRRFNPFYFNRDHTTPNDTFLVTTDGVDETAEVRSMRTCNLVLTEKLTSIAS